jgi:hypothetical protein
MAAAVRIDAGEELGEFTRPISMHEIMALTCRIGKLCGVAPEGIYFSLLVRTLKAMGYVFRDEWIAPAGLTTPATAEADSHACARFGRPTRDVPDAVSVKLSAQRSAFSARMWHVRSCHPVLTRA